MGRPRVCLVILAGALWLALAGVGLILGGLPPGLDPRQLAAGSAVLGLALATGALAWRHLAERARAAEPAKLSRSAP